MIRAEIKQKSEYSVWMMRAFRKGQTYGTILVDLEKRQAIDLSPDREAETLKTWLQAHPEIEVVSRDRAPAYADGRHTARRTAGETGCRPLSSVEEFARGFREIFRMKVCVAQTIAYYAASWTLIFSRN